MRKNVVRQTLKLTALGALTLTGLSSYGAWDYGRHHDWSDHRGYGGRDRDYSYRGGHRYYRNEIIIGATVVSPPEGYSRIYYHGHPYYYYEGVYYDSSPDGYVVVNPPVGALVPSLPPGATPVIVGRTTYYDVDGTYYVAQPDGYLVVDPPQTVVYSEPRAVGNSYYQEGRNWARDVRDDVVSRDALIDYLRGHLVGASKTDITDFRNGFIEAYGPNGAAAFDKAFQHAR